MSIEIIPAGASAVVTDHHKGHRDNDGGWVAAVAAKDTEAGLERSMGSKFVDTIEAVKDAEAGIERSVGDKFVETVQDIKDAEADLERSMGDKFVQTVQDIKDAEARLERSAGDRFMKTVEDIKDGELATERSKAKVLEALRESEYRNEKTEGHTRELMLKEFKDAAVEQCEGFDEVGDKVEAARRELLLNQMKEFKEAQGLAYKLAVQADKTACNNQLQVLLQFKDAAHQADKLAMNASKELADCCCELKELIRDDGAKTRALINDQERDRLRDRANKAEAGLAAYFAAKVPPTIPVL